PGRVRPPGLGLRPGPPGQAAPGRVGEQFRGGDGVVSLPRPAEGTPFDDLQDAARELLIAIGEDPSREGLAETPRRVAESLAFLTEGYGIDPRRVVEDALFEHSGDDLVVLRDIPFHSLCEHHLLPFFG